jgi:hypothetical protein
VSTRPMTGREVSESMLIGSCAEGTDARIDINNALIAQRRVAIKSLYMRISPLSSSERNPGSHPGEPSDVIDDRLHSQRRKLVRSLLLP